MPPFSLPYVVVHDAPPLAAALDCENVLDWLPAPQVAGQAPQLLHVPTQFTGHAAVLHC